MLEQLFVNICIFISFIYFAGIVTKKREKLVFNFSLTMGIFFGVLGLALMYFTIPLSHDTIADLRHLAPVAAAVYIGWIPSLISALIITLGRILMYGVTPSSIVAGIGMIGIGITCSLFTRLPLSNLFKLQLMNLVSLTIIFIALLKNLGFSLTLSIFPYHFLTSIFGGFIAFIIAEQIKRTNEQFRFLEKSATKDFLTNLNNVRQFDSSYNEALKHATEKNEKLSFLLMDIDHFKTVNDTFGHHAGDEVLKELGKVLLTHSRSFDIVSRNGGEEFSVLLLDCPHPYAMTIAERIRGAVEKHTFPINKDQSITITISIGVSTFPDTVSSSGEEIFEQADKALYFAKRSGRNRVCDYQMVQSIL